MNNERIKARTFFRFEDFYDRLGVEGVGGKSVNCLRRQRNDVAFAQQFNRRSAVG
jgi:hypothetical protein